MERSKPGLYYQINLCRRVVAAKLFIDRNYAEKIEVNQIADEAHLSKFHFIRLFNEFYGFTPHQYLIKVRVEKARFLLAGNNTVKEVCEAVGFESLSSFSGLFKRRNGLSPSAYREAQKQLNADRRQRPLRYIPACHIPAMFPIDVNEQF